MAKGRGGGGLGGGDGGGEGGGDGGGDGGGEGGGLGGGGEEKKEEEKAADSARTAAEEVVVAKEVEMAALYLTLYVEARTKVKSLGGTSQTDSRIRPCSNECHIIYTR